MPADGSTTSTITVTLLDANSNPVSGKTVTLAAGGGSSTISAASGSSNASGVVTFTVKDLVAQSVTYTGTDTTDSNLVILDTATVTFTASKLVFTTASFGSPTANICYGPITVQTQDGSSNPTDPPSTVSVALSSTGPHGSFWSSSGCSGSISSVSIATSANSASFYYKNTVSGPETITATATGGVTSAPSQAE